MITFEEAYKIAKNFKSNIDNCTEYENGWVFSCYDDDNYIGGWGHTPVVILRNGQKTILPEFVCNGTGKELCHFDL